MKALVAARKELEGDGEKPKANKKKRKRPQAKKAEPKMTPKPITQSAIVSVPVVTNELIHKSPTTNL